MADSIQNGWGAQAIDIEQELRRYQNVVIDGCAVTDGTNALEHDVASGTVVVAGTEHAVSATTVTLTSGGSDPRKDLIYVDSTGTVSVAQGTYQPARPTGEVRRETYQPTPPDLSATDATVLAEVWVAANATDTASADISDRRLMGDAVFRIMEAIRAMENATYTSLSDVPTTLAEGAQVYVEDDNTLYVEDGT